MEISTGMETEITCPDCGKIIAAPGQVPEAQRCRCAELKREQEQRDAEMAPAKPSKTCYVCGKALEGRRRLKDKLGRYWCKDCADADERLKKREEDLRCPDCGRVFPDHKLVYFQTDRV